MDSAFEPDARRTGPGATTGRTGTLVIEEHAQIVAPRPAGGAGTQMRDRVRWGPVWSGLIVTVATYVLLQLALIASGAYEAAIGQVEGVNEGAMLSGIVGLVAFLLGGLVAGATALWKDAVNGALHGIVMWALAVVALIGMAILGGGFAAGAVGEVANQFDRDVTVEDFDAAQAGESAREASGVALLALTLALVAAVAGGVAGAKMWPRGRDDMEVDLRSEHDAGDSIDDDRAGHRS